MKKNQDMLGVFLAGITGAALLIALFVQAFLPRVILPRLDGIALVLLSLTALLLDHYIVRGSCRDYRFIPLYGALIFGIFPLASSFAAPMDALLLAVLGAAVFAACTWLFDTMLDRLSSGPAAKAAPFVSALGLFLAAQCLMGIV